MKQKVDLSKMTQEQRDRYFSAVRQLFKGESIHVGEEPKKEEPKKDEA